MSELQPITYRGLTVAVATPRRVFLADELEGRPAEDPEVVFVLYMAFCAVDVLAGQLPGPYSDENARAYARAALIPARCSGAPRPPATRAWPTAWASPSTSCTPRARTTPPNPKSVADSA